MQLITTDTTERILNQITSVKIAVYGDFCLDVYWMLDAKGGEISVETGIKTEVVQRQYYSLGGASNVVANIAALNPAHIYACGVVGADIFGRELMRQLQALKVNTDALVIQAENFDTMAYGKRYIGDIESPRIDFGCLNQRSAASDRAIVQHLDKLLQIVDVLIFNQQVPNSLPNDNFFTAMNDLFQKYANKVILLDTRHYGDRFSGMCRKTNATEAAQLNGMDAKPDDSIPLDKIRQHAIALYEQSQKPVFITRGDRGILVADQTGLHEVPGIQIYNPIDAVGAGDTTVSALALAMGAGSTPADAASFANIAASVTVQKRFITGTASTDEVNSAAQHVDYRFRPELAEDIRAAVYIPNTEIECCTPASEIPVGQIQHVIFDHDGTISVLRQGWEAIMEDIMIHAILGEQYNTCPAEKYKRIVHRVRSFIDISTGIQTIIQMEGLVGLVKEFGMVPDEAILDKFGYKAIYNKSLLQMVDQRIAKLERAELLPADFRIHGIMNMLNALLEHGVTLYMASGTDIADVKREAETLGYATLFNGGIYGAVDDINKFSKRLLVRQIISSHNLKGPELAVFGDGPVEIRECKKNGGIAIGIASNELRRFGLDPAKRSRLILAGADIIVPDFTQTEQLVRLLFPADAE